MPDAIGGHLIKEKKEEKERKKENSQMKCKEILITQVRVNFSDMVIL